MRRHRLEALRRHRHGAEAEGAAERRASKNGPKRVMAPSRFSRGEPGDQRRRRRCRGPRRRRRRARAPAESRPAARSGCGGRARRGDRRASHAAAPRATTSAPRCLKQRTAEQHLARQAAEAGGGLGPAEDGERLGAGAGVDHAVEVVGPGRRPAGAGSRASRPGRRRAARPAASTAASGTCQTTMALAVQPSPRWRTMTPSRPISPAASRARMPREDLGLGAAEARRQRREGARGQGEAVRQRLQDRPVAGLRARPGPRRAPAAPATGRRARSRGRR